MLLPYATKSRIPFWKRRIFDFKISTISKALPKYPYHVPPGNAFPEHLDDKYRQRFFHYFTSKEVWALDVISEHFKKDKHSLLDPIQLDLLGDKICEKIEASDELGHLIRKRGEINLDLELCLQPIWNSVFLDVCLLIGAALKQRYPSHDPEWGLVDNKMQPTDWLRAPIILMKGALPDRSPIKNSILSEERVLGELLDNHPEMLNANTEDWHRLVNKELTKYGFKFEKDRHYRIREYIRYQDAEEYLFPVFYAVRAFFLYAIVTKFKLYEIDNNYEAPFSILSLGDTIRPDAHPNWSGFPTLEEN